MAKRSKRLLFCSVSALISASFGLQTAAASAQTTNPPESETAPGEIVVTAQHRSENIQKVPIAISAFSNANLQQRGLTSVAQIAALTPNVEIKNNASFAGSSQILSASIRGIGQNDFAFNLEPGVGVYIDGVYYARSLGAVVDLLDLERIEVLKGPQGTLFGRNTIGGALNISTREPDKHQHFAIEGTTGSFNRSDVRGSVDMPLIEGKLLSQFSFSYKRRDGYQQRIPFPGAAGKATDLGSFVTAGNASGPDKLGGENALNLRGKLKWIVTPALKFLLSADYTYVDQGARPITLIKTFAGPTSGTVFSAYNGCLFGAAPGFICSTRGHLGTSYNGVNVDGNPNNDRLPISDAFVTGNIDKTYAQGSNYDKLKTGGVSLTGDWSLSGSTAIKSITAYRELHSSFGTENVGTPFAANDASFSMNQAQFSQEIQLTNTALDGRLKSLVGLYYFNETGDLTDYPIIAEGLIQINGYNRFRNDAYAAFTHEHFDVTDKLGITFGVRTTREDKRFQGFQKDLNSFFLRSRGFDPSLPLPVAALALLPDPTDPTRLYPLGVNRLSFNNTSFKLGAEYNPTRNILGYYSFSQGFKSGGWTTRLLDLISPPNDINQLTFRPEKADTHEIGLKSSWFDRKIRLNLAAFSTDYRDIQVTQYNGISPIFRNAGTATIRGFEAETQASLGELSLSASIGYTDAYYRSLAPGVTFSINNKLVNTPEWSGAVGGLWRHAIGTGKASVSIDYTYKSNIHPDAENSPYLQSGNVGLLNASVGYAGKDEAWQIQLGVQNLTDKRFVTGGWDQSAPGQVGFVSASYSPPRQWYLTVRFKG